VILEDPPGCVSTYDHLGPLRQPDPNLPPYSTTRKALSKRYLSDAKSRALSSLPAWSRLNTTRENHYGSRERDSPSAVLSTPRDNCQRKSKLRDPAVSPTEICQACEKALSSVSSYVHASTEEWNTTIINTILGTLVAETTSTSNSGGTSQPAFKYVVNSTIIQHAPTSSNGSSDLTAAGRRGMHAASGAYWNNEKDGMWSYKYSAAEKKGLDVVIGVTWIWV
jgi:Tctex-1 family